MDRKPQGIGDYDPRFGGVRSYWVDPVSGERTETSQKTPICDPERLDPADVGVYLGTLSIEERLAVEDDALSAEALRELRERRNTIETMQRDILRYGQHQPQCLTRLRLPRCNCGYRALVMEIQKRKETPA